LFLFFENSFSQEQSFIKLENLFESRIVYQFGFLNDDLWFYDGMLNKYHNSELTSYDINDTTSGFLENYKSKNSAESKHFDNMMVVDENIYLVNQNSLLKINNDSVFIYKLDYRNEHKHNQLIKFLKGPDKSILFQIIYYDLNGEPRNHIYIFNNGKFSPYNINESIDSCKVREVISNANYIYAVEVAGDTYNLYYRLKCIKDNKVTKIIKLDSYLSYFMYHNDISGDTLFLLNNIGKFYTIADDSLISKADVPLHAGQNCFDFQLKGNNLYYSNKRGLFRYNRESGDTLKLVNFPIYINNSESIINKLLVQEKSIYFNYVNLFQCYDNNTYGLSKIYIEY
jgi:hypothetical protein